MHPAVQLREEIIKERGLTLVRVFDTNQHEPDKDVCLVTDAGGMELVLRVGEVRPEGILEDGFEGEHIVVPKRVAWSADPAWELELYLDGPELISLMNKMDTVVPLEGHSSRDIMEDRMVKGFWEMQTAWTDIGLPPAEQKAIEHAKGALNLLAAQEKMRVLAVARTHETFLRGQYPSKWKYSKDNVLWIRADGRLGLIDLARMGLRHWGYDIGWIYWPEWYTMSAQEWEDVDGYIARLQQLFDLVKTMKPAEVDLDPAVIEKMLWLDCIVRIIGGFYDVAQNISHAQDIAEDEGRREVFLMFLRGLLQGSLSRVE